MTKERGEIRKLGATSFQGVCPRSKRTKARKTIRKRSGRGTGENRVRAAKPALAIVQSFFQEE